MYDFRDGLSHLVNLMINYSLTDEQAEKALIIIRNLDKRSL